MNEAHLIRIHEAWIAHHVAAVCKVDGQYGSATILDRAGAVVVKLLVIVGRDIASGEHCFDVLQERRVDRHHVFIMAVDWTVLNHPDLAIALDNLGFYLANFFVYQDRYVLLTANNCFTSLNHTLRTK